MGTRIHNYKEVREYLEQEHPDWLQALTPRHINAPADYWPQKVLAVSSVNANGQPRGRGKPAPLAIDRAVLPVGLRIIASSNSGSYRPHHSS